MLTSSFIIDSQDTVEFYSAFQSRAGIENKTSRLEMVLGRILSAYQLISKIKCSLLLSLIIWMSQIWEKTSMTSQTA